MFTDIESIKLFFTCAVIIDNNSDDTIDVTTVIDMYMINLFLKFSLFSRFEKPVYRQIKIPNNLNSSVVSSLTSISNLQIIDQCLLEAFLKRIGYR